jgi:hypothetical protein
MSPVERIDQQAAERSSDVVPAASQGEETFVAMGGGSEMSVTQPQRRAPRVRRIGPRRFQITEDCAPPVGPAPFAATYGTMKGRIRIASDFDELPDDIADAFGMR